MMMKEFTLCLRNTTRNGSPPIAQEIRDDGIALKLLIQNTGVLDRMVIVFSSLLGEEASDSNTFTRRLVR